jgi:hypothetical protein
MNKGSELNCIADTNFFFYGAKAQFLVMASLLPGF